MEGLTLYRCTHGPRNLTCTNYHISAHMVTSQVPHSHTAPTVLRPCGQYNGGQSTGSNPRHCRVASSTAIHSHIGCIPANSYISPGKFGATMYQREEEGRRRTEPKTEGVDLGGDRRGGSTARAMRNSCTASCPATPSRHPTATATLHMDHTSLAHVWGLSEGGDGGVRDETVGEGGGSRS